MERQHIVHYAIKTRLQNYIVFGSEKTRSLSKDVFYIEYMNSIVENVGSVVKGGDRIQITS